MPLKIHLRQIPPGRWEGDEDVASFGLPEAGALPLGPLKYRLEGNVSKGELYIMGVLSLKVRLQCVACLRFFEYNIHIDNLLLQIPLDGRESVDLTPLVREDILLALPLYPRCDSTRERSCAITFPTEAKAVDGERSESDTAWEALKKLNIQKKS
ncbi:MAG: hypothetical protein C5B47_06035 [Verrucomicrobia bacterium]|nr:MAG: hypothetical protein C5B47_06035 [Verrucomicrobiota bacterium]